MWKVQETTWETVIYETQDNLARITMNRPEVRNAQDTKMLSELAAAFEAAAADDEIRVIILAGKGPSFSAGHDLRNAASMREISQSIERWYQHEEVYFQGLCMRWRDIPKPTIAQVQGHAIMAGVMIAAACDLIIAADNATFADMGVRFTAPSSEFFYHPWDLGPRKAKEFLFTGDPIDAHEAHRLGLVNRVVPLDKLEEETTALAQKIALSDPFLLKLAKLSINGFQDALGFRIVQDKATALHMLAHARFRADGKPEAMAAVLGGGGSLREWLAQRDRAYREG